MPLTQRNSGTGVRLIDLDHREIANLLDEVSRSVAAGHSMQYVATMLSSLHQMTLTHFAFEESMMQATRFPKLNLHLLEHQWLAEQAGSLIARARNRGLQEDDKLLQFFMQAHSGHIQFGDNQFGHWLNNTTVAPQARSSFPAATSTQA